MSHDATPSRRRVLKLSGAAIAGSVSLAGCTDDGDGEEGPDESNGTETPTDGTPEDGETPEVISESTIELGAETSGWVGQSPSQIEEETNPTLGLEAGQSYEITWENLDGEEHELIIADAGDAEVAASDSSEEEGDTVTLEFEASEQTVAYFCEYHPDDMRGDIAGTGDDAEDEDNGTAGEDNETGAEDNETANGGTETSDDDDY